MDLQYGVERNSRSQRQSWPQIQLGFCFVNAIECSIITNRLNCVEKVYKPFEPSGTKKENGNGYNRV
jgi:hypothetical protein